MLLDKRDMSMLALGQERHEPIKVLARRGRCDRRSRHDPQHNAKCAHSHLIPHEAHAKNRKN
jgi:hypothetical protein